MNNKNIIKLAQDYSSICKVKKQKITLFDMSTLDINKIKAGTYENPYVYVDNGKVYLFHMEDEKICLRFYFSFIKYSEVVIK